MRQYLSAISEKLLVSWFLVVAGVACLLGVVIFLRVITDPEFWFVPSIPIPSYAMHITHSAMPYGEGSLGGYRIIRFETNQPVSQIQQFYWAELHKLGWHFLCAPTQLEQPGCPLGLSPSLELAEAFSRDDEPGKYRAIDVEIYRNGENVAGGNNRLVEVIEYRYPKETP